MGRGHAVEAVDELAPETPSAWATLATLAVIWSTPVLALVVAAWVSTQII